jgi:hypothetical protein
MSCREEQDLAGTVIDSLKFAADEGCITGKLALTSLPRLADVLVRPAGWLHCDLVGLRETGDAGRPGLHLRVSGQLGLCCQRCLAEVDFECVIDSRLLLTLPGESEIDGTLKINLGKTTLTTQVKPSAYPQTQTRLASFTSFTQTHQLAMQPTSWPNQHIGQTMETRQSEFAGNATLVSSKLQAVDDCSG